MRRGLPVVLLVLLSATLARADIVTYAGGGAYRCATVTGRVPGGNASLIVCEEYGAAAAGTTLAPPALLSGVLTVATTKGTDRRPFRSDPSKPDTDMLATFLMDPSMTVAQIELLIATITVDVTITSTAVPMVLPGSQLRRSAGATPMVCVRADAGAEADREGAVSATSSMISSSKGGGRLTHATAKLFSGASAGTFASYIAKPNAVAIC